MIRRSFLKLMGASPVALPVIARESTAAALTGNSISGITGLVSASGIRNYILNDDDKDYKNSVRELVRAQNRNKLSKYDIEVIRLDPDLACMKSFSLSAVMRIQSERNIARKKIEIKEYIRAKFDSIKPLAAIMDLDSFLKICDTDEATVEKFIDGLNFDGSSGKAG